jgi:hypothetical protein
VDDEILGPLGRAQRDEDAMSTGEPATAGPLHRPLDAQERAQVLDGLLQRLERDGSTTAASAPPPAVVPLSAARERNKTRWVGVAMVALAIAAALVLWIGRRDAGVQLPGYAITVLDGGAADVRSDPRAVDRTVVLRTGDRISLVVTPDRPATAAVAVWLLARGGGPSQLVRVDATVAPSGAVKLEGALDRWLKLAPGEWTIDVVVGPADRAPADAEAAQQDAQLRRASFRVRISPDG